MDTVTQFVLGAAVGQLAGYRRLGRAALLWGGIGGTIPDLDTLAYAPLGPFAEWEYHRGFTHSLWFGPVVGTALGYALWRFQKRRRPKSPRAAPEALPAWIAVLALAMVTHPLLDLCTIYGTMLLAPFSDARFAIPAVPIIDPVYTLTLLAALVVGIAWPGRVARAQTAAAVALALTTAYLFWGWAQNQQAERIAREQVGPAGEVRAYTGMFTLFLRRLVIDEPERVRIGFVSTWSPGPIRWTERSRDSGPLVAAARALPEVRLFQRFASGQVLAQQHGSVVEFTDLRYGFPGATVAGFWGVRVAFDAAGNPGAPERFAVPRGASFSAVLDLFRASFAGANTLL